MELNFAWDGIILTGLYKLRTIGLLLLIVFIGSPGVGVQNFRKGNIIILYLI